MSSFSMTHDGYVAAKQYLIDIGRHAEFLANATSVDGFSLVAFANSVKENNDGIDHGE